MEVPPADLFSKSPSKAGNDSDDGNPLSSAATLFGGETTHFNDLQQEDGFGGPQNH